jgi:nucleoside-diphosphate-sugar epimerase
MERAMGAAWPTTKDHIDHSPCCSIEKGQQLLDYHPRYTTEQIYVECLEYLLESGQLRV